MKLLYKPIGLVLGIGYGWSGAQAMFGTALETPGFLLPVVPVPVSGSLVPVVPVVVSGSLVPVAVLVALVMPVLGGAAIEHCSSKLRKLARVSV